MQHRYPVISTVVKPDKPRLSYVVPLGLAVRRLVIEGRWYTG